MKKLFAVALALMLAPLSALANFEEGTHYTTFNQSAYTGKPVVTEFFSFYCGHCYSFEQNMVPTLKKELGGKEIGFEQFHVDFIGGAMGPEMSRALAVAVLLKKEDVIKPAMFSAIHNARRNFATVNDVRQLFVDNGVSAEEFDKASSSFMVNTMVKKWKKAQQDSGIRGVPSLMVNHKYLVDTSKVESLGQLLELLSFLAAKQ